MHMMAALIARIRRAANRAVVLRHALAQLAKDAIGIQEIPKPFKARGVIWEHSLEVSVGKPLHPWLLLFHEYRLAC
jgi:hypothetical protein